MSSSLIHIIILMVTVVLTTMREIKPSAHYPGAMTIRIDY
jgi:hypothetical protein